MNVTSPRGQSGSQGGPLSEVRLGIAGGQERPNLRPHSPNAAIKRHVNGDYERGVGTPMKPPDEYILLCNISYNALVILIISY